MEIGTPMRMVTAKTRVRVSMAYLPSVAAEPPSRPARRSASILATRFRIISAQPTGMAR